MHKYKVQSLIVLCLFLSLAACQSQAKSPEPGEVQVTSNDKTYPAPNFTLTDLNGKKFSLKELQGKPVFLDFWATWCPPCVVSVPEVKRFEEEYKAKGLQVVSISLDDAREMESVKRFVKKHEMQNRVALVGATGVDSDYGIQGIPAFFLIDQKGNISKVWEGYSPRMPQSWRQELDKLIGL